jgi:hypothetical protein
MWNRCSAVGIATGYLLDDQGVGDGVRLGSKFLSPTRRPYMFWDIPNLLANGYRR